MKLICEINLPDDASDDLINTAIREAGKTRSMWKERRDKLYRALQTNLEGKCGSCKNFVYCGTKNISTGTCKNSKAYFVRTRKACKKYERREDI